MKRVYILTLALALLLTACTAGAPADSEAPSAATAQTFAPETAAPSEIPGSESTAPVESATSEITDPMGTPTPESSVPAETAAPTSAAPTQTPTPANTAPAETYAPASSAPETAPPPESAAPAQTPEPTNPIKEQESNTMTITINGRTFLATLYDNETVAALKEKMPLTLNMSELNGNEKYNYMVHFAIADNSGKSAAVEYVNNEMLVTETPILTNFYLAEGEKQGVGTQQSHIRFDILTETLVANPAMTVAQVRDALDSVSKDNFGEFESTEWSVVFDQSALTATYYHRENYEKAYPFRLLERGER